LGLIWPSRGVTQKAEGTNVGAGSTWPKGSIPWKGHSELAPLDAVITQLWMKHN